MMRFFRSFLLLIVISTSPCLALDEGALIEAVEQQNISEVIQFFEEIETISWNEAEELITRFYEHYISQLGPEILNDEYLRTLEQCKAMYHYILESHGIPLENGLIQYDIDTNHELLLCMKKTREKDQLPIEAEVPTSMLLGGIEILGGSLVWVLPFPGTKQLGGLMIADGVRRTFDGLGELDEENKQAQNSSGAFHS